MVEIAGADEKNLLRLRAKHFCPKAIRIIRRTMLMICGLWICLTALAQQSFVPAKWRVQKGNEFPHGPQMVQDLLPKKPLPGKTKEEVRTMLGPASRENENYLYCLVEETKFGLFKLRTEPLWFFSIPKAGLN